MPTTYFWVPMADDAIDQWAVGRCDQLRGNAKILPRRHNHNEFPSNTLDGKKGRWGDIRSYDTVLVCAHGVATSLGKVGWASNGAVTKWTAEELANMFSANFSTAGCSNNLLLDVHLTACWGANRFTIISESFGKTFAKKMKAVGIKGTLTAYQGAGQLNIYGDYQIGSSRWTSALLHWKLTGVGNTSGLASSGKRNRFGVRVAYPRDDMSVTWNMAST